MILAIDIGGTFIKFGLVDDDLELAVNLKSQLQRQLRLLADFRKHSLII